MTMLAIPTIQVYYEELHPPTVEASNSDEQWEFLKDYAKLIEYADVLGYKLTAGELTRTAYQQRYNIAHGLSWTMNSYHLKRKAGDLNLFIGGTYQTSIEAYRTLGEYWESLDSKNKWGGSWQRTPDAPHFQRSD